MKNESGITPLGAMVLIDPKRVEMRTAKGVYLPEQHVDRANVSQTTGMVVEIGPAACDHGKNPLGELIQPGQRVLFKKFSGAAIKGLDGRDYWVVVDEDIHAIIDETETAEVAA